MAIFSAVAVKATPDVPQAPRVEMIASRMAMGAGTWMPNVLARVRDIMVITTAAPSMLMVDPRGMDTE